MSFEVSMTQDGLPDVQQWLVEVEKKFSELLSRKSTMGNLETFLEDQLKALGRPLLERAAQKLADQQPMRCATCNAALRRESYRRLRRVESVCGIVDIARDYGYCPHCRRWVYPADHALGLHARALSSPRVQEQCALMVLGQPAQQAAEDFRRITRLHLGHATMHREAVRQGNRALQLRNADVALTKSMPGLLKLSARATKTQHPFTLVIEIDAWHIRERDDWGKTKALLKQGVCPERWHWVYTATVFRLEDRRKTPSDRPIITQRGYVATRQGVDSFEEQLYAEAILRGLLSARTTLIIADGAIWIWNLAQNRFSNATHRLDLYHLKQHLWCVAHDIFGQGSKEASAWLQPLFHHLEHRKTGALDVIQNIQQLHDTLQKISPSQKKNLQKEINYLNANKDRMDYKTAKTLGQPLGSGAVESTCSQYQRRFKCTGQFWTLAGDEALLALYSLYRNRRWHRLFPHNPTPSTS